MSYLKTKQILVIAANIYKNKKIHLPKDKLKKKFKELKYLSSQKNVPKLTLRKELIHLENQLSGIFGLENYLLQQSNRESEKITILKRENTNLKKKLVAIDDEDMQKKINKLSHLLAETLAKKSAEEDVALSKRIMDELHLKAPLKKVVPKITPEESKQEIILEKLLVRLNLLKDELKKLEIENKEPQKVFEIKNKINLIEEKLKNYFSETEAETVKHTMIFESRYSKQDEVRSEELPLPPPPQIESGMF